MKLPLTKKPSVFSVFFVLLLVVSLPGCSSDSTSSADSDQPLLDETDGGMTDGDQNANSDNNDNDAMEQMASAQTVNAENANSLLRYVFSIYTSAFLEDRLYTPESILPELQLVDSTYDPEAFIATADYACVNGGTAVSRERAAFEYFSDIELSDCMSGTETLNGRMEVFRQGGAYSELTYQDFVSTDTNGYATTLNGKYTTTSFVCRSDNYTSRNTSNLIYRQQGSGDPTEISITSVNHGFGTNCGEPWRVSIAGSFSARAAQTGSSMITVEASEPLVGDDQSSLGFSEGLLTITAEDGSSLELQPLGEDVSLASIRIIDKSDVESVLVQPWNTILTDELAWWLTR